MWHSIDRCGEPDAKQVCAAAKGEALQRKRFVPLSLELTEANVFGALLWRDETNDSLRSAVAARSSTTQCAVLMQVSRSRE